MKYINKLIVLHGYLFRQCHVWMSMTTCPQMEQLQDAAISEYLNQFDLLKSYINRTGTPFRLAAPCRRE